MVPGIYVHIPFCRVRCTYCDFPLTTRRALSDAYYKALQAEIAMRPAPPAADSLYFGGGTPSLIPLDVLARLVSGFRLEPDPEVTLEANPDDITAESLAAWKEAGINRLSIGVQSLEPAVLKAVLRRHTPEEALAALELAQRSGFSNISVDLMIGPPGQTVGGFFDGLRRIIACRPQHLSLYLLELHEKTALDTQLKQGRQSTLPEDEQVECYSGAINYLRSCGYEHYEVSNFALPGCASRHNIKYWTGAPYYGYGAGAFSFVDSCRIENLPSVPLYIQAVTEGRLPVKTSAVEDAETIMRNAVIFGLRRREGIDMRQFEENYHLPLLSLFPDQAEAFMEDGFLELSGTRLRLTLRGILLSNEILSTVV